MKLVLSLAALLAVTASTSSAAERIVSGGGTLTEIIYALGAQDELVAADISSVYPPEATKLPQIGYARQLSAEGILGTNPTMLVVADDAGPTAVIDQVKAAGVKVVTVTHGHTPEAAEERILKIGEALNRKAGAEKIAASLKADLEVTRKEVESQPARPKVLFIYARGGGTMNVAGRDTSAESIIELAGGKNAVDGYQGYKPLTAEGAVEAAPDFILVSTRGLEAAGGIDGLLQQPGLALTPAGKEKRVVVLDDLYLLGFGPRLGQAARELSEQLHPAAQAKK